MPMDKGMRGFTSAALSLQNKNKGEDLEVDKKLKVIKDVVKKKHQKGIDNFDPDPEIEDQDTVVKT